MAGAAIFRRGQDYELRVRVRDQIANLHVGEVAAHNLLGRLLNKG